MKLYLIQRSGSGEEFLKIGVTRKNDPMERHYYGATKVVDSSLPLADIVKRVLIDKQKYLEEGPYPKVTPVLTLNFEEDSQALFVEHSVKEKFKEIAYRPKMPFNGASECFALSEDNQNRIRAFIEAEHQTLTGMMFMLRYKFASIGIREKDPIVRHRAIVKSMEEKFPSK